MTAADGPLSASMTSWAMPTISGPQNGLESPDFTGCAFNRPPPCPAPENLPQGKTRWIGADVADGENQRAGFMRASDHIGDNLHAADCDRKPNMADYEQGFLRKQLEMELRAQLRRGVLEAYWDPQANVYAGRDAGKIELMTIIAERIDADGPAARSTDLQTLAQLLMLIDARPLPTDESSD